MFGGVADSDKTDPEGSMRFAMGTITYWSILAAIFMVGATLINSRRQHTKDGLSLKDSGAFEFNSKRSPKSPSASAHRRPVVLPEEALMGS